MEIDYEIIDHTADLGFRVQVASAAEVVRASVAALCDLITPVGHFGKTKSADIRVEAEDLPGLLHALLEEVLFHFEVEGDLLPHTDSLSVVEPEVGKRAWSLSATLAGEHLDPRRHEVERVVKAVTLHGLRFEPRSGDDGWMAEVILDL